MKKQDEPDFYKLAKTSPLPELEDSVGTLNTNMMALQRQGNSGGGLPGMQAMLPFGQFAAAFPPGMPGMPSMPGMPPPSAIFDGFNIPPVMQGGKQGGNSINRMMGGAFGEPSLGSGIGGPGTNGEAGGAVGQDPQLYQLQRLRHLQQLQLFQRQIGAASLAGAEDLARIQAEHALGLRGSRP